MISLIEMEGLNTTSATLNWMNEIDDVRISHNASDFGTNIRVLLIRILEVTARWS